MPATSQQQQKLFGLALSVKRGDTPRSEVSDEVLQIVDTMSEKKIKDFAETSHKGLPTKIETFIRGMVRETFRNMVLGETITESSQRSRNFFKVNRYGVDILKLLNGKWDRKKVEKYFEKDLENSKKSNVLGWFHKLKWIADSVGINPYPHQNNKERLIKLIIDTIEPLFNEYILSVNEQIEQLDEKLIVYSNRAPYGQVVFIAGGAGSGKGFAVSNFLDSASFKVRDVDEMKKQLQKLNAIGKLSIQQILDRFGKNIKPADLEAIKKIQSDGYDLKTMDLKKPDHVYALHILVKAMDIKDQTLANMLGAAKNPEALPNIMFDITAKEITDITDVVPQLLAVGYKPNNIHLAWVLSNYQVAIKANQERNRVVPADILLKTHIGAGNTIWGLVTKALPKGMNGRVDVILNNRENTINITDKAGNDILVQPRGKKEPQPVVKGFLSLPVKKQGGGILPEKLWKDILYNWIKDNGPKELTANM
jgi:hypothetical protein